MNVDLEGGCLCGAFRYGLKARPGSLGDCHCIDCRRSSGAPFVTWGTVDRGDFLVERGELRRIPFAHRVRGFASCCGTHILFEESPQAGTVDVTIASLDDPSPFPPEKAIWLEDKLPWVPLDPRLPGYAQSSDGNSPLQGMTDVRRGMIPPEYLLR